MPSPSGTRKRPPQNTSIPPSQQQPSANIINNPPTPSPQSKSITGRGLFPSSAAALTPRTLRWGGPAAPHGSPSPRPRRSVLCCICVVCVCVSQSMIDMTDDGLRLFPSLIWTPDIYVYTLSTMIESHDSIVESRCATIRTVRPLPAVCVCVCLFHRINK